MAGDGISLSELAHVLRQMLIKLRLLLKRCWNILCLAKTSLQEAKKVFPWKTSDKSTADLFKLIMV